MRIKPQKLIAFMRFLQLHITYQAANSIPKPCSAVVNHIPTPITAGKHYPTVRRLNSLLSIPLPAHCHFLLLLHTSRNRVNHG